MTNVTFYFNMDASLDEAWDALESFGCEMLYSTEDELEKFIVGRLPKNLSAEVLLKQFPQIKKIDETSLATIDWESQWQIHGVDYRQGCIHVDLLNYLTAEIPLKTKELILKAGPGFGDLSHPSTRLILRMMGKFMPASHVIDIGSGSGILSFAARAMGASVIEGIDIVPEALEHARENSVLNGMEQQVTFFLPEDYHWSKRDAKALVLMNMIQMEQQQAWQALSSLHEHTVGAITSGILSEGRQAYLELTQSWGWQLVDELEEDGWLAFHFKG